MESLIAIVVVLWAAAFQYSLEKSNVFIPTAKLLKK